jgi:crotonobetainyl-CoA:carnitine CoA-transferase CaiB-like acyl-CoA transferase
VLGCDELALHPDYAGNPGRVVNRAPLLAVLAAAIEKIDTEELSARLDDVGVPNAPLLTVDRVATHPQTLALKMMACADGDTLPLMGLPVSFNGDRPRQTAAVPSLGQQTQAWRNACKATAGQHAGHDQLAEEG